MHAMRVGEYELLLPSTSTQPRVPRSLHPFATDAASAPSTFRGNARTPSTASGGAPNLMHTQWCSSAMATAVSCMLQGSEWTKSSINEGGGEPGVGLLCDNKRQQHSTGRAARATHRAPKTMTVVLVDALHTSGDTEDMVGSSVATSIAADVQPAAVVIANVTLERELGIVHSSRV